MLALTFPQTRTMAAAATVPTTGGGKNKRKVRLDVLYCIYVHNR